MQRIDALAEMTRSITGFTALVVSDSREAGGSFQASRLEQHFRAVSCLDPSLFSFATCVMA
eukprot:3492378-Amphidinium_carterae.1